MTVSYEAAQELDRHDPLAPLRREFLLPEGIVYLDGNSLGALPRSTPGRVRNLVEGQWGGDLIAGWNDHGWYDAPQRVGDKIARLIGAGPGEVVAADSTSVNLYKCVDAAIQLRPDRSVVVTEPGNFPTDLYMLQGYVRRRPGLELQLHDIDDLHAALDETVAVVVLTHVHYRTARRRDLEGITRRAHEVGATIVWDLSHSAGAVTLDLNAARADFAVGCGYKYLNGGPGCPGFIFVAARHQDAVESPLSGWLGHEDPFAFDDEYRPAKGVTRFLCGSHPVLGLAALETGVDVLLTTSMPLLECKSKALTKLFLDLVGARCPELEVASPSDADERGSHVSLLHPEGYAIVQALISRGIVGDYRAPSLLRFGFAPLYLSHADVWKAANTLVEVIEQRLWDREEYRVRGAVT